MNGLQAFLDCETRLRALADDTPDEPERARRFAADLAVAIGAPEAADGCVEVVTPPGGLTVERCTTLTVRVPEDDLAAAVTEAGGVVVRGDRGQTVSDLYQAIRGGKGGLARDSGTAPSAAPPAAGP